MDKRVVIILMSLFLFTLAFTACTQASYAAFAEDTYIIYMAESRDLTPEVILRPTTASYMLTSSNPSLVSVSDDGKSLRANYQDSIVTVTLTAGRHVDYATIIVYPELDYLEPDIPDELFHVTFDTFGRGSIATQDLLPNELATRPPYTTFQNYGLAEWYTDVELTQVYDFNAPVTQSFTLYAEWVEIKTPVFTYSMPSDNGVTVTGIKYPLVDYGPISIPAETENGLPVIGIANAAFYKFDSAGARIDIKLTSLTIPSTVKTIGESAFQSCAYLTEIIFEGAGIENIGINAFKDCSVLTNLILPNSLTAIGEGAFYNCTQYAPVIPTSVTVLDQDTYRGTAITHLDLSLATYVHARSFKDCVALTEITPPNTNILVKIEAEAFTGSGWISAKRVLASSEPLSEDTGLIILGDVVILCVKDPNRTHSSISVRVPANIKYIAGGAFPESTIKNGFIKFSSPTPPKIETYAISSSVNLALVIPNSGEQQDEVYQTYYSGITLTALRPKISYELIIDGLTMYVNNPPTTSNYFVYIAKYEPTVSPGTFNLRRLLFTTFNSSVTVRKIKYGAFDATLAQVAATHVIILPPKLMSIETNAFYKFANLSLYIYGTEEDYGTYLPESTYANNSFINDYSSTGVRLYIPDLTLNGSSLVEIYKSKWKSYFNSNYMLVGSPPADEL
ncbi:MAG: leucine-rich repeat protein [Christensenellaceae bacterium]|jgi:hypothetical protein|nr:leucine-rich repeat protein [Christensenellaceae bacterium]